ncbi:MAG: site-specific integrase [Limisphaerales bacterium]
MVDFRRGPLGPYFDRFAAHLKDRGYSDRVAKGTLGKCCQFNAFLIEKRITHGRQITETLMDDFLNVYLLHTRTARPYSPRGDARRALKHLLDYLIQIKVLKPPKAKAVKTLYSWLLDPYLEHLQDECEFSEVTIQRARVQVGSFLATLQQKAKRHYFQSLSPAMVEGYVKQHLKDSPENLSALASSLRRFFRYCVARGHTRTDFSGLIPSIRRYRHVSLPKGMEDSALERMLNSIPKDTPNGSRDYAMIMLMMAYGIRGVSAAELLLDDIDWQHSRLRIRAQKGGKEVLLPLLEPVGEALIGYLRHRSDRTPFREVFLTVKAPFRPLNSVAISHIVREYMEKAGVAMTGGGSRTLRHSWAIRALGHNSPIKTIADVLGHRYIDTTFIYAKADLRSLREVAMPWPKKG